jgi:adenosylcobinamide-GDP ribazoletransferase
MRQGDVGPFGVVALLLTVLLQVAAAATLLESGRGWTVLVAAPLVARLAMARTGLASVPMAAGSALGRSVAGTVSARWLAGWVFLTAVVLTVADQALLAGAAAGLLAAELLLRRARARLGGVTGDVMGAMGETAAAATLLVAAAGLP